VYYDSGDFWNVAERAGIVEQAEHLTLSSGASQRTVFEVRRCASPFSQPLLVLGGSVTRWVVLICQGEEVGGDGALIGLLKTGKAERAWLEEA